MISSEKSKKLRGVGSFPHRTNPLGWACWLIEELVAANFAVKSEDLHALSRGPVEVAFARQTAIYLAHVVLGLNYTDAGAIFRRDRTTASYACQLVESRRDNLEIEKRLHLLEEVCHDLLGGISKVVSP